MAVVSPAGPAPATSTSGSCVRGVVVPVMAHSYFIGQGVFRKTACIQRVALSSECRIGGMTTRKYEQRLRAAAAEQTRRAVLDAVYAQLRATPAKPVSVEQVAQAAGVSRSTVYLVFGSRAGLFDALTHDLWWNRAGFPQVVRAVEHPDARTHMRDGIDPGARRAAPPRAPPPPPGAPRRAPPRRSAPPSPPPPARTCAPASTRGRVCSPPTATSSAH